jgi:hypothetical protein
MSARRSLTGVVAGSIMLSGCSILSPIPLWEMTKAAGSGAALGMQSSAGQAVDTVYHRHAPFKSVCIEFNPGAQAADVLPALQRALQVHSIESRIYEGQLTLSSCPVWLRYSTLMEWGRAPMTDRYQSYVSEASLTLQSAQGQVLSSSHYMVDPVFGSSKWASTFDKLAPVVSALVTGFATENRSTYLSSKGAS